MTSYGEATRLPKWQLNWAYTPATLTQLRPRMRVHAHKQRIFAGVCYYNCQLTVSSISPPGCRLEGTLTASARCLAHTSGYWAAQGVQGIAANQYKVDCLVQTLPSGLCQVKFSEQFSWQRY